MPYPAPAAAHAPGAARPGSRAGARPGRPGWRGRWVLAACLAAALGFGGIALWQHQEAVQARGSLIESTRRTGPVEELAEVLAAPDAKVSAARFEDGATGCVIVSRSESKAAFIASGLPKLPDGQVYKLWYDDAGTTRAAAPCGAAATGTSNSSTGPSTRRPPSASRSNRPPVPSARPPHRSV